MSKKSEVIQARRLALGLSVISNETLEGTRPTLKAAAPQAPVSQPQTFLDTSTAFANHCMDGKGIGSGMDTLTPRHGSTVAATAPATPVRSTAKLSLVTGSKDFAG